MTIEETQRLLALPELCEIETLIGSETGHVVLSNTAVSRYQRDLARLGMSFDQVVGLLAAKRDQIVKLGKALLATHQANDGEFPVGEELPNEQSNDEVIGLEGGFALTYTCYLHALESGADVLLAFLKWKRIPGAVKFAREIQRSVA